MVTAAIPHLRATGIMEGKDIDPVVRKDINAAIESMVPSKVLPIQLLIRYGDNGGCKECHSVADVCVTVSTGLTRLDASNKYIYRCEKLIKGFYNSDANISFV